MIHPEISDAQWTTVQRIVADCRRMGATTEMRGTALAASGALPPSHTWRNGAVRVPSASERGHWYTIIGDTCDCPAGQHRGRCSHLAYHEACQRGRHPQTREEGDTSLPVPSPCRSAAQLFRPE